MSFRPRNSSRNRGCYFSLAMVGCIAAGAVLWMVDTGFLSKSQLALPGQYTDLWCRPSNGWRPGDPPSLSSFYLLLSYSDTLPIAFNIALCLAALCPPYPLFNCSGSHHPMLCVCLCADSYFTWSLLTSFYRTHLLMNLQYCTSPLFRQEKQTQAIGNLTAVLF